MKCCTDPVLRSPLAIATATMRARKPIGSNHSRLNQRAADSDPWRDPVSYGHRAGPRGRVHDILACREFRPIAQARPALALGRRVGQRASGIGMIGFIGIVAHLQHLALCREVDSHTISMMSALRRTEVSAPVAGRCLVAIGVVLAVER